MTNDPPADTPVVILVLDALASALVDGFAGDDDFVVVIFVVVSRDLSAAGCLLAGKTAVVVHRRASPLLRNDLGNAADADHECAGSGWVVYAGRGPAVQEF
jgi:hypothetical protein